MMSMRVFRAPPLFNCGCCVVDVYDGQTETDTGRMEDRPAVAAAARRLDPRGLHVCSYVHWSHSLSRLSTI